VKPLQVPRWIIAALWLPVVAYAVFATWTLSGGYRSAARGEMPLYTDYTPRYAASLLLQAAPAEYLYVPDAMRQAGREAARAIYPGITEQQAAGVGFAPWMFPPTFMLVVAPLALVPYWISWTAWLALTALPYLAAIRRILPAALALPFALAAPPAFFNVMFGQTGFLVAGLIALGLTQLEERPWLAGVLIGLASIKPHFGLLIPLALLAGGYWRTLAAATLTVVALIAASIMAFGDEPWFAFLGTFQFNLEAFQVGAINLIPMTSLLSTLTLAGLTLESAWHAQYLMSAGMAMLVAWSWWIGRKCPDTLGLRCAILCLATPLAVPLAFLYDLVLIVPAAAWLVADLLRRQGRGWEYALLALCLAALLVVKPLAAASFQVGPLLIAGLLGLGLRRLGRHGRVEAASVQGC
jgi:alpha-1,2-mannosyltransferase